MELPAVCRNGAAFADPIAHTAGTSWAREMLYSLRFQLGAQPPPEDFSERTRRGALGLVEGQVLFATLAEEKVPTFARAPAYQAGALFPAGRSCQEDHRANVSAGASRTSRGPARALGRTELEASARVHRGMRSACSAHSPIYSGIDLRDSGQRRV